MLYQKILLACLLILAVTKTDSCNCKAQEYSYASEINAINNDDLIKPSVDNDVVVLQALDKVTARVMTIKTKVGHPTSFGTLHITARRCLQTPPEDPPEAVAYLEIRDNNLSTDLSTVFQGWMFASNPSLSALEHPVYDIWVKDCQDAHVANHQTLSQQNNVDTHISKTILPPIVSIPHNDQPAVKLEDIEDNPPVLSAEPS